MHKFVHMSKKDCKEGVVINKNDVGTLLKQVCKKYGVDADSVFQYGCARKPVQEMYKCRVSYSERLDTHLFAIKFFPDDNVYVAWNLWEGARGATNFSLATLSSEVQQSIQREAFRRRAEA